MITRAAAAPLAVAAVLAPAGAAYAQGTTAAGVAASSSANYGASGHTAFLPTNSDRLKWVGAVVGLTACGQLIGWLLMPPGPKEQKLKALDKRIGERVGDAFNRGFDEGYYDRRRNPTPLSDWDRSLPPNVQNAIEEAESAAYYNGAAQGLHARRRLL